MIEEIGMMKTEHARQQLENQRRSHFTAKPLSDRTLRLMEDIVAADIAYDRKHRICYDDKPGIVRRIINRLRRAA
jgi:hypothetical protein